MSNVKAAILAAESCFPSDLHSVDAPILVPYWVVATLMAEAVKRREADDGSPMWDSDEYPTKSDHSKPPRK